MTIFFSCKDNFQKVQQIGVLENAPVGEADTINLKYTDSSRLVANLLSSKMLDYSNRSFGYSEFPEGIELILYDKDNNKIEQFEYVYDDSDTVILQKHYDI